MMPRFLLRGICLIAFFALVVTQPTRGQDEDPVVTEFDVVPAWPRRPENVSGKGWVSGQAVDAEDRVRFFRKGPDSVQVYTPDDQLWVCGSSPHWWFRHGQYPEYKDQVLMRFTTSGRILQTWTLPLGDIGTNKDLPNTSKLKPGETVGAHCIAQDSKGNVDVGDIYGERAQNFVPVSKR